VGRLLTLLRKKGGLPFPAGTITLPATFNNQLSASLSSDGSRVDYATSPYDLMDFTLTDAYTDYYLNYVTGDNADDGLSSANAFKTFDYAISAMTLPAVLHVEDEIVGYFSKATTGGGTAVSGKLKVKSASPSGRTIFAAMRESYTLATFAWAASGSEGAFVSTTAAAKYYRAQFDADVKDANGIPTPITAAADIATCQATPGTYFYDSGTTYLYVHMADGRVPDPADGWLYAESPYVHWWLQALTTNAGVLLFEDCDFLANTGQAPSATFRFRPVTAGASEDPNESYVGLRNCLAYGGASSLFEFYDAGVVALDNCHARYSRRDGFNYHSFRTADTKGEYITVYEHDCTALDAGYDGFADQVALGTSENGSSAHDSMHVVRTNCVHGTTRGAVVADVNGVHSLNYNVGASDPGAAAVPRALYWHEKYLGAGTTKEMLLWGCYGTDGGDEDVFITSDAQQDGGSENAGDITLEHWHGQSGGAIQGVAKDAEGNTLTVTP
jgi:hypothetical protein